MRAQTSSKLILIMLVPTITSFAVVRDDGTEIVVAKQQERSVTSVRLPAGSAGNGYSTTVRALIVDAFGAKATFEFSVTVHSLCSLLIPTIC